MSDVPRRGVLGAGLVSALASGGVSGRAAMADPRTTGNIRTAATQVAMAALPAPSVGDLIFLEEPGRDGWFVCGVVGSAQAADPEHGLFCPSSIAALAYHRIWDGTHGRPEWFGARPGDRAFDCAPAIEACYALCAVTELATADYYVRRTLRFGRSGRTVTGVGRYGTVQGQTTRIILSRDAPGAGRDDILLVGAMSRPAGGGGPGEGEHLVAENHFGGLTLLREAACIPHPSGDPALYPTGLRAKWLYHCSLRDIASLESSIGFYFGGTVYTKADDCLGRRVNAGTRAEGDLAIGYLLDGRVASGYAGGNASLYLTRCLAMDQHPAHVDATGLRAVGAFVDSFIDRFESARIATGIALAVDGALAPTQTIDLHIRSPVIDSCRRGIDIDLGLTSSTSIDLTTPYIAAAAGGGEHGIAIRDGAGLVTLTGGQVHGDFADGSLFLSRTRGVSVAGTKIHQAVAPVIVSQASGLQLAVQINNYAKSSPGCAIQAHALSRSILRPTIVGADGPAFAGGVALDADCAFCAIDGSAIDPGCFAVPEAANKVRFAGQDARTGPGAAAFEKAGNRLVGVIG